MLARAPFLSQLLGQLGLLETGVLNPRGDVPQLSLTVAEVACIQVPGFESSG